MKSTRQDKVIDLNEVWWDRQFAAIQQQAEQIEEAIFKVLNEGHDCEYHPNEVYSLIGLTNYKILGNTAAWTPYILYFEGKPAFTVNASGSRHKGVAIINCGRLVRGRLEFFYCDNFEEVLAAARRYAREHILPELESEDGP